MDRALELVGDIGGTHARFALVEPGSDQLECVSVQLCADYDSLADAVIAYLEHTGAGSVRRACMAIACPVDEETIRLTNNAWVIQKDKTRKALGLTELKILNDFVAMALGIRAVSRDELHAVGGGQAGSKRTKLIAGPGTGLGVSALVPARAQWIALASEGGHVEFAPTNDLEVAVQRHLKTRFGRVSVERILSGPGLLNLYQALADIRHFPITIHSPEAVTTAALKQQDPHAYEALELFCRILGRVVGDTALTLGSLGGVYLCGGMLPGLVDFIRNSEFRAAFEDKGRMRSMMERIPVFVVTEPHTGLLGAAAGLADDQV